MAKSKFKRRSRGELTAGHILQLATGQDFFGNGFGQDALGKPIDLDAMREAWSDWTIRQRVYATDQFKRNGVAFAEIAFGPEGIGGMVVIAADLKAARAEYRRRSGRVSVLSNTQFMRE